MIFLQGCDGYRKNQVSVMFFALLRTIFTAFSLFDNKMNKLKRLLTLNPTLDPTPSSVLKLFTISSAIKYWKDNLQDIFKTILKARPLIALLIAFSKGLCKRFFKARFPNIYCNKIHIKSYNFYRYCKDYFAITRSKKPNYIPFAVLFFQDQALFN